jgi:NDP-sugar pyrophosphorylase family protein
MVPIGGRPILEHLIALLRRHGVTQVAINLHYKPDLIMSYFGDGRHCGVAITYSLEPRLLGTAGAAKRLDWFLSDTFLVLYGDVLTDLDLSAFWASHRATGALGTLALYEVEDPTRCGMVELAPDGRVRRFVEKPPPGVVVPGNLANAGIYILEPAALRYVPRDQPFDFGRDLFPKVLRLGLPLFGRRTDSYVLDVGSPQRHAQARADLRSGRLRLSPGRRELQGTWSGWC